MCPLRFILIFFSAIIAIFAAYQMTMEEMPEDEQSGDAGADKSSKKGGKGQVSENDEDSIERKVLKGAKVVAFTTWDWASGMYLWRWFKKQLGWAVSVPPSISSHSSVAPLASSSCSSEPKSKALPPSVLSSASIKQEEKSLTARKRRSPLAEAS
eukprot:gb/GEZN01008642.1/.p1 GENE.gb/GEZN01008642.1/~~gb/GEZN01008642.1/.p1  ORF type:complete len:155 (-),score=32.33 gb/GEZN01008642.1/:608-1072(-)